MTRKNQGLLFGLATYIQWGFLSLFWKLLAGVSAYNTFSWRIVFTVVTMLTYALVAKQNTRFKKELVELWQDKKALLRMLLASFFIAANWLIYIYAVGHGQATQASLGYYILPSDLSYKDAVAASSIANVAIAALFAGDLVKAGRAIQGDMFHERYRQKLVKEFVTIKELSGQYGAYATYLSGAGPTVMTLTPNDQAEALKTAIDGLGLDGETLILSVDKGGVVVD